MTGYNITLDPLPTDYKGWLIRTDFRIGLQISICMEDPDLDDAEKTAAALHLLYGNGIPDIQTALEGLKWFMRCGAEERDDIPNKHQEPLIYYDFDAGRIWASFKATFGIDLYRDKLHWFEFCYLLSSCGEDTSIREAMKIRDYSTKDLKGAERQKLIEAKRALKPPEKESEAERERNDDFKRQMQQIGAMQNGSV